MGCNTGKIIVVDDEYKLDFYQVKMHVLRNHVSGRDVLRVAHRKPLRMVFIPEESVGQVTKGFTKSRKVTNITHQSNRFTMKEKINDEKIIKKNPINTKRSLKSRKLFKRNVKRLIRYKRSNSIVIPGLCYWINDKCSFNISRSSDFLGGLFDVSGSTSGSLSGFNSGWGSAVITPRPTSTSHGSDNRGSHEKSRLSRVNAGMGGSDSGEREKKGVIVNEGVIGSVMNRVDISNRFFQRKSRRKGYWCIALVLIEDEGDEHINLRIIFKQNRRKNEGQNKINEEEIDQVNDDKELDIDYKETSSQLSSSTCNSDGDSLRSLDMTDPVWTYYDMIAEYATQKGGYFQRKDVFKMGYEFYISKKYVVDLYFQKLKNHVDGDRQSEEMKKEETDDDDDEDGFQLACIGNINSEELFCLKYQIDFRKALEQAIDKWCFCVPFDANTPRVTVTHREMKNFINVAKLEDHIEEKLA